MAGEEGAEGTVGGPGFEGEGELGAEESVAWADGPGQVGGIEKMGGQDKGQSVRANEMAEGGGVGEDRVG